jgi:hypothetical protein
MKREQKKEPVKYPLFTVRDTNSNELLQIIARTPSEALSRACVIWLRKKKAAPNEVVVKRSGTMDYVPALKVPHYEA